MWLLRECHSRTSGTCEDDPMVCEPSMKLFTCFDLFFSCSGEYSIHPHIRLSFDLPRPANKALVISLTNDIPCSLVLSSAYLRPSPSRRPSSFVQVPSLTVFHPLIQSFSCQTLRTRRERSLLPIRAGLSSSQPSLVRRYAQ